MEIIRGKIPCAKKVVIYGPEGIGKSTFASHFPNPVFIDTEGSTNAMDVARLPKATSWQMLMEQIDYIKVHSDLCKTLVIDTIDWAEMMCVEHICNKYQKKGIEDFGYGNGYVYTKEEFGRFLNKLSELVERGTNVVLTAHAQIRKFEQPDELGAYDRWELKLGKKTSSQTSPLVKEWADMLLFANYKTYSVVADDKGKKHKAQGGARVMYTAHHPCWDAKNRYGLPEEVPFEYGSIAHIIGDTAMTPPTQTPPQPITPPEAAKDPVQVTTAAVSHGGAQPQIDATIPVQFSWDGQQMALPLDDTPKDTGQALLPSLDPQIPKALRDLMEMNQVLEWDIQNVVAARGYFPSDMPVRDYPEDFVMGVLVGAWEQVYAMIKDMKENLEIPFN